MMLSDWLVPLGLLAICAGSLMLTSCATSRNAACYAYEANKVMVSEHDTAETIDQYAALNAAMVEACR